MLKASARNSRSLVSVKWNALNNDRSSTLAPGLVMLYAPALPPVKGAAVVTALVLNHRLGPRPPEGAAAGFWPATMSGRQEVHTPWQPLYPKVACVPVRIVKIPFVIQPPSTWLSGRDHDDPRALPLPNGSS